jgi:hypothetical protein
MRRILGNKIAFAITLSIFAFGLGCNALLGGGIVLPFHSCTVAVSPEALDVSHGPTMPPDPWLPSSGVVLTAHGPTMPPDPWLPSSGAILTAHGPTMPPDPWLPSSGAILTAHGPTMPPDPWLPSSGAVPSSGAAV